MSNDDSAVYEALKAFGHSPAKAAEIMRDADRGDQHAIRWLAMVGASSIVGDHEKRHPA